MATADIIKSLFNTELRDNAEAKKVFELFEGEIKEKKAASGIMSLFSREGRKQGEILLADNKPDEFLNWLKRLGGGDLSEFKEIKDIDLRYFKRRADEALKSGLGKKELRGEYLEEWKGFKDQVQNMQRTLELGDQINLKHVKAQLKEIGTFSRDASKAVQGLESLAPLATATTANNAAGVVRTALGGHFEPGNIKVIGDKVELHIHEGAKAQKITLGKMESGTFKVDSNGIGEAVESVIARGDELANKPMAIIEQMEKSIATGKEHLKEFQATVDQFGEKLGEKAVFTKSVLAASENAGRAVAETKGKLLVRGEGATALFAKNEATMAKAKNIGVMSAAEYETLNPVSKFFANAKANILGKATVTEGIVTNAETHGFGMKSLRLGGTGLGVILMGAGLKEAFVPGVDENGQPQEANWLKIGGEVVGGAALAATALTLGGHGAKGLG